MNELLLIAVFGAFNVVLVAAVKADLKCVDCSDPQNGTENEPCAADNFVVSNMVDHATCAFGACYVIMVKHNDTDDIAIRRGCTNGLTGMPYTLPPEGCYRWKGSDMCICYSDECNVLPKDYLDTGNTELDAHVKSTDNTDRGPVKCYQCMNFDDKGKEYKQCPKDEAVTDGRVYIDYCNSTCFTRSFADNKNRVARGCTDTQWGLPVPLPADGCYNWNGGTWCICSAEGCNGRPLGQTSGKDLDDHLAEVLENYEEDDGLNRCYECINYDKKGTYYPQCPKNKRVRNAYYRVCNTTCFTRSYDYDDKIVARGCTDTQYGLPDPLPPDGCYKWYSEVWCVCSKTRCNAKAIGDPQDLEFDAHVKKDGSGAAAPSPIINNLNFIYTFLSWLLTVCVGQLQSYN